MCKKLIVFCLVLAVAMSLPARADYKSTVLADDPCGYWEFEDRASGDGAPLADSAAGGLSPGVYRNLLEGSPNDLPDVALVPGVLGKAAEFHGTFGSGKGNFVQIFDSAAQGYRLESSKTLSYEFWEKANPQAVENYARFLSHSGGWDTPNVNYWMGMTTDVAGENHGQPFVGVPDQTWYAWPPLILDDGDWHHVVVTHAYDSDANTTETNLFIDAINQGSRTDPGYFRPPSDWEDLLLGAENDQGWVYNGLIGLMDEVAYYDYALSARQIKAHYDAIPEPATIALLGLGGLALLRRKRA